MTGSFFPSSEQAFTYRVCVASMLEFKWKQGNCNFEGKLTRLSRDIKLASIAARILQNSLGYKKLPVKLK